MKFSTIIIFVTACKNFSFGTFFIVFGIESDVVHYDNDLLLSFELSITSQESFTFIFEHSY